MLKTLATANVDRLLHHARLPDQRRADVANSMLGVSFNHAIFAAGVAGAVVISNFDGRVLPVVLVGLAAVALFIAVGGRRTAFAT